MKEFTYSDVEWLLGAVSQLVHLAVIWNLTKLSTMGLVKDVLPAQNAYNNNKQCM